MFMLATVTAMILSQTFVHVADDQQARITVHAREILHSLSPYMTGACIEDVNHEIYGGLYSQMVYGESFQEPAPPTKIAGIQASDRDGAVQGEEARVSGSDGNAPTPIPSAAEYERSEVSGMWRPVLSGTAHGRFSLETSAPFLGRQSQEIVFREGNGEVGIENRGLNRWGMAFQAGKPYEGVLWARAAAGTEITLALQSADGVHNYAAATVHPKGEGWERLTFTLRPQQTDPAGRLAVLLRRPGTATLGYAFLQPGKWGRFHDLPVRRDVAEGLRAAGLTVLRYGGSMINAAEYRWKQMIGPRDRRPPYAGTWYPHSSNGWGIPDFLNFCAAAGFLGIPAFNMDETPQDMADFIEYANGPSDSKWGRQRAADGHPHPYHLRYIELGNEEAVDESYWQRFEPMIKAIWAKDPQIIPVVGDFAYDHRIVDPYQFTGAPRIQSLAAHKKILDLAREMGKEVWFDVHVWNQEADQPQNVDGVATFSEQLGKISPNARYQVVVFELNADKHGVQRALGTAHAINQLQRIGDKVRIVCSANGLQPDGQNDNGWNQGLLFLDPAHVWAQPPYYALQMLAQNALPCCVRSEVQAATGALDVTALTAANGNILSLQVLNFGEKPVSTQILLDGFQPSRAEAQITSLSGPLDAVNTSSAPNQIVPGRHRWRHGLHACATEYTFPAHSFTILRFE